MAFQTEQPIPTPLRRHARHWRRRYAPMIVWAAAIVLAILLGRERSAELVVPGVVETRQVAVSAVRAGRVQGVHVDLFESVDVGQAVALMDDTVIRAPMAGKVSNILVVAGETVASGSPLLTIAQSDTTRVVGYVDTAQAKGLKIGEEVVVASRQGNGVVAKGKILRLGPAVQALPSQLRRHPNYPQWGLPILVGDVPEGRFHPGEALDIRLTASR